MFSTRKGINTFDYCKEWNVIGKLSSKIINAFFYLEGGRARTEPIATHQTSEGVDKIVMTQRTSKYTGLVLDELGRAISDKASWQSINYIVSI